MNPADNINNLFKHSKITVGPDVDKKILNKAAAALPRKAASPDRNIWSIIMQSQITKPLAAAVLIITALTGIYQLTGSFDGATFAFAQVLNNIQNRGYTFNQLIETSGEVSQVSKAAVMEPGLIRWELKDGPFGTAAMIHNAINGEMAWVSQKGTVVGITELPPNDRLKLWGNAVSNLWDLKDGSEEILGKNTISGKKVMGFKVVKPVDFGTIIFTVWVDIQTNLPILVEILPSSASSKDDNNFKIILKDFDYDVAIDPSLFSMKIEPQTVEDDTRKLTIRVGEGIGDLLFGMSAELVKKYMGQPDMIIGDSAFQYPGFALMMRDQKFSGLMCGDPNPKDSTVLPECRCKTVEGIGIGSSAADIIAVYGEPSLTRSGNVDSSTELIYREKIMKFTLVDDKVTHMFFGPRK